MKCQDFRELIDSYLCDELLTETNHEVLRHLEHCRNCREITEERRIFRARLRSAVQNCGELKICEKFKANLRSSLKQNISSEQTSKKYLFFGNYSWVAVAAGFIVAVVFGVWFFQDRGATIQPEYVKNIENNESIYLQKIALGDHQNCAVNYKLTEEPVEINVQSPQYANLREGVIVPLKKEFGQCKFVESHICKYEGHTFTHLVFDYEGKMLSILLTDLKNYKSLEGNYIAHLSERGYQIAHFDVDKKAVFVISDLPAPRNSTVAEVLEPPLRRQIFDDRQASRISFINYSR